MKPVTVSSTHALVMSLTDGRLITRLNLRLMEYYWHGDKTMQNPTNTTQGEADEQLPKRIAWQ